MAHHEELLKKLSECASACEWCHDACLGEEDDVKMLARCIRLDRDCAKICHLTAGLAASHSPFASRMVKLCEEICTSAEECENHDMDHCRDCAGGRACRSLRRGSELFCRDFQEDIGWGHTGPEKRFLRIRLVNSLPGILLRRVLPLYPPCFQICHPTGRPSGQVSVSWSGY
jgi:hypothetical protein